MKVTTVIKQDLQPASVGGGSSDIGGGSGNIEGGGMANGFTGV